MGAFSFASGFFDRLNSQRDKEEENDLAIQKNMMNVWATTTLPQIRKQRADDDATLSDANGYLQMDQFQKQPELAFYAAKQIRAGRYSDVGEFLSKYNTDPNAVVPPEIRQKQLEALGKTFAYDTDQTTGKVTNFRFQPRKDDSAPIAGSQDKYNGIGDLFMGKRNPANVAEEARTKFKGMTGEDPTNPDAVGSRLNSMPSSGTVSITPVDTRAQHLKDIMVNTAAQNFDKLKNGSEFLAALQTGNYDNVIKTIGKPGAFYTREDLQNQDFQKGLREAVLSRALAGDFKDPTGVLNTIAQGGKFDVRTLAKEIKTPEDKAKEAGRMKMLQDMYTPNGDLDWIRIMNTPKVFEEIIPEEKDRDNFKREFNTYMANKAMTDMQKVIASMPNGKELSEKLGKPTMNYGSGSDQPPPAAAPAAAQPEQPKEEPKSASPNEVPGSFGSDPNYKPPQEEKPVQPMDNLRLGESKADGSVQTSVSLAKAVTDGDTKSIESANPYAVMKTFGYTKNRIKDPEKVVQAIRFSERDQQQIRNQQFIKDYDFDSIAPYMKKYDSLDQAVRDAPVGSAVIVKGRYVFITQDQKRALEK